jgi:hypothetical protein
MDGAVLDAAGAMCAGRTSKSREVMCPRSPGCSRARMSRAAAAFIAAQSQFLSLLEAYKRSSGRRRSCGEEAPVGRGIGSEEAEAPAAEEAPVEEAATRPRRKHGESED